MANLDNYLNKDFQPGPVVSRPNPFHAPGQASLPPLASCKVENSVLRKILQALVFAVRKADTARLVFKTDGVHAEAIDDQHTRICNIHLTRIDLHHPDLPTTPIVVGINVKGMDKLLRKYNLPPTEMLTMTLSADSKAIFLSSKGRAIPRVSFAFATGKPEHEEELNMAKFPAECSFALRSKDFQRATTLIDGAAEYTLVSFDDGGLSFDSTDDSAESKVTFPRGRLANQAQEFRGKPVPAETAPLFPTAILVKIAKILGPVTEMITFKLNPAAPMEIGAWFGHDSRIAFAIAPAIEDHDSEGDEDSEDRPKDPGDSAIASAGDAQDQGSTVEVDVP
nr:hypothetical protein [Candidatus Sigynarchaeota archaeon]